VKGGATIRSYLAELSSRRSWRRVDAERLRFEVADHLAEAAANYQRAGLAPEDAERRALERFGSIEELAREIDRMEGGLMSSKASRTAVMVALISSATLVIVDVIASGSVTAGPLLATAAVGAIALGVSVLAFAGIGGPALVRAWRRAPVRIALWGLGALGLATLAGWGGAVERSGDLAGRVYLAGVGALCLLIVVACRPFRYLAGIGLIAAGIVGFLIATSITGLGLGQLGEGQANIDVVVLCVGWTFLLVEWLGSWDARRAVGGWVGALGHRIQPLPETVEAATD
jgi:hypothetical protein